MSPNSPWGRAASRRPTTPARSRWGSVSSSVFLKGASMTFGWGRVASLALAVVFAPIGVPSVKAQEKVKIGLDLTISGYHAGWLVAQKLGYFSEQGLDVTINRGYGSGDTAQKVKNGEIDVGFH